MTLLSDLLPAPPLGSLVLHSNDEQNDLDVLAYLVGHTRKTMGELLEMMVRTLSSISLDVVPDRIWRLVSSTVLSYFSLGSTVDESIAI